MPSWRSGMRKRVEWLRGALRNLDEEAAHVAADDPKAAQRVVQRILQAVAALAEHPEIGRPGRVPGTRGPGGARTR